MEKFVPYEKLSKKKKRELDLKRRKTWEISPVTRKPQNPKAYNRKKTRKRDPEDFPNASFLCILHSADFCKSAKSAEVFHFALLESVSNN